MNGRLGKFTLQPDQMQALNPVLILLFIPIFETIIYPLFGKCNLLKRYMYMPKRFVITWTMYMCIWITHFLL